MGGADAARDAADPLLHRRPGRLRHRPKRPLQEDRLRDDVVAEAGLEVRDRHDGRVEDVHRPGDHRLERQDDLRGNRDRVERQVRRRRVTAAARRR